MSHLFQKGHSGNPLGRPKGSLNKVKVEIREAARHIVESRSYVASLKKRLREGKAPHMEPVLFYYAYGKPIDWVAPGTSDGTRYEPGRDTEELVRLIADIRILLGKAYLAPNNSGVIHWGGERTHIDEEVKRE